MDNERSGKTTEAIARNIARVRNVALFTGLSGMVIAGAGAVFGDANIVELGKTVTVYSGLVAAPFLDILGGFIELAADDICDEKGAYQSDPTRKHLWMTRSGTGVLLHRAFAK